ncbi:cation-transporting P-type ATPase [Legionella spiritensis]|uniref:cation-transporting P-type ATPase n=1 Tax=Legionella spiritensis TaxID=452 RepID=UPI000F6E8AC1|nr:cation-transporting P-type ATPase [Legionella spiritensis]VEG92150.1 cation transport ATPase [Legionella spiritensis]
MIEQRLKDHRDNWHAQPVDKILPWLETDINGLNQEEVTKRQARLGLNHLPEKAKESIIVRFLRHFNNILIYVLLFAALITALLNHWVDTLVILAVVIANACIGFIQEGKAEKALDAIRQMLSPAATVLRRKERQTIPAKELVPGDIVLLESGDKVPADMRLIKVHGLIVDESILTGESVSVEKHSEPVAQDAVLGERTSMAYSGTLVTSGQAKGVVIATGQFTEIGQISHLLSKVEMLKTPLIQQIDIFAKWLTILILMVAGLLLVHGYFAQHHDFGELFMVIVGLSVSAIPEGLPAVLSITLAIGVQAMAQRNAIIRRLPAIETLGSVSVICTDKTGTLTKNEMTVVSILTANKQFNVEGSGYAPSGSITLADQIIEKAQHPLLVDLARSSVLCNDAVLYERNEDWTIEGDPMEGALLTMAEKTGLSVTWEREIWARTDTIPFDASHRFMATLNHNHQEHAFIFVKGAPEQLLAMCQKQQNETGGLEPINPTYWLKKIEAIAKNGQRVLALASKAVPPEHTILQLSDVENNLVLLGMVGMIDPPREQAIAAVAQCLSAGIQVKMITGDHSATAGAIGRQIGLKHPDKILTGLELDKMSDAELASMVLENDIFARTSPEHKLRLVMALQSHGMIVAMTGDGVNDALALKRADAGIAMGKKGNEVSKEAAELVLADDNFASIAAAVQEGRTVYDNLKKVISWTLPTNGGESMTIILALLFGLSLPVTPIQILWINLITAVTLGLSLAFEPTEDNTMQRPPRPRNEPILTGTLVWHILLVSFLFVCAVFGIYYYALDKGYSIELSRTIALNTLVVLEIFHLFYIRNIYGTSLTWQAVKGTGMVWMSVIVITIAQFAITYLPPLQRIFTTRSIPFWDGVLIIAIGVVFFAVIETEKQLRLRIVALRHLDTPSHYKEGV